MKYTNDEKPIKDFITKTIIILIACIIFMSLIEIALIPVLFLKLKLGLPIN